MKSYLTMIALVVLFSACGGGKKNDNVTPVEQPPKAATLSFPDQNAVCISGTVISTTQSTVQFKWTAGENADSYEVVAKNLLTSDSSMTSTTQTTASINLTRNAPFSWYVVSKSSKSSVTANSVLWKFYNAGAGVTSYAPFPADALTPANGQNVTVSASGNITLSWKGADADNDIVSYDIYFGTAAAPALYKSGVTAQTLGDVPATSKTTYYWKVVTHDSQNNTSTSDIVNFITN